MPLRKRRKLVRAFLLVVEGETEEAFCLYLKRLLSRNVGHQIFIENARGGSPDAVVEYAFRLSLHRSFEKVAVFIDSDKPVSVKARRLLATLGAELLQSTPCIEGLLLTALGEAPCDTSAACKRRFHAVGLRGSQKTSSEHYKTILPLDRLETMRQELELLDKLMRLFENRC